jgi:DNA recombination protein RmuC
MNDPAFIGILLLSIVATASAAMLAFRLQASRLELAAAKANLVSAETAARLAAQDAATSANTLNAAKAEVSSLRERLVVAENTLQLERGQFDEKIALLKESKQELSLQFKNLANEIFDDKSKRFEEKNQQSLSALLNPLQDKIKTFEKRVEESYNSEARERHSLGNEIKKLHELNDRLGVEAANLVQALKGDNKSQGNWGEMILTKLLERSGLTKGKEYEVQMSLNAEDGSRLQPDVVVHLPEARELIIDSKVSLKAWEAYTSAESPEDKAAHIKAHVQSVRAHVRGLSSKNYQNLIGVNTLDYVFLFMPIEAAYSIAIQEDPDINHDAFEKNVIFVGPTTLLTTLKTVQTLWRFEQQNQNAKQIAEAAGKLYDKFVAFSEDIEDLGKKIKATNESYDKAHNKLKSGRGNLISRTEKLRLLGAKTAKQHKQEVLQEALADEIAADSDTQSIGLDDASSDDV